VLAFSSSTTFTERFVEATSAFLRSYMPRENARLGFDGLWDEIISAFTVPAILKQNPAIVIALRDGQVECREYGMSYTFGNIWGCSTVACSDTACNGILRVRSHPRKSHPTRGWHHWLQVICPVCKHKSTTIDRPLWLQAISLNGKFFWKPLQHSIQMYIWQNWDQPRHHD
jgi:hypothetical protein